MSLRFVTLFACLPAFMGAAIAHADEVVWKKLGQGGHIVLLRHTSTGSENETKDFKIGDCSTQLNLSERGKEEAQRIGAAFRSRNVPVGQVLSSGLCRCLDTAKLAFGQAEHWQPLDLFYYHPERGAAQTQALRQRVGETPTQGNLVLVTHLPNISELTGSRVKDGEFVVLTPDGRGGFSVTGRVAPSDLPK